MADANAPDLETPSTPELSDAAAEHEEWRQVTELLAAWRKIEDLLRSSASAASMAQDLQDEIRTISNSVARAVALPEGALRDGVETARDLVALLSDAALTARSKAEHYQQAVHGALLDALGSERVRVPWGDGPDSGADFVCRIAPDRTVAIEVKLGARADRLDTIRRLARRVRIGGLSVGLVVVTQTLHARIRGSSHFSVVGGLGVRVSGV